MSEPMYLLGDRYAQRVITETNRERDLECGDCGHQMTVPTSEEHDNGLILWRADWECPNCQASNQEEGEYEYEPDYIKESEW